MASSLPATLAAWWRCLVRPEQGAELILGQDLPRHFDRVLLVAIVGLYALYGFGMGCSHSPLGGASVALKLPLLPLLTLAVCLPAFYVLNTLRGPRLKPRQCLRLLLVATGANAAALGSFVPVAWYFTAVSGYRFLVLMHVLAFASAGFGSLGVIASLFRAVARLRGHALPWWFLGAWGALYGFVGTQMSWVLRPWIGNSNQLYALLRPVEGSFFGSVLQLLSGLF